jgi:hypothetical protein
MTRAWSAGLVLLAGIAGCSAETGDLVNQRVGERGNGYFGYVCVNDDDAACPGGAGAAPAFPSSIAQGAQLRLAFSQPREEAERTGRPILGLPTSEYVQTLDGDLFTTVKPGYAGIFVRGSLDPSILDFTHVRVLPVSDVRLEDRLREPYAPDLSVDRSDSVYVRAVPIGVSGQTLAGALACTWSVSNDAVLLVQGSAPSAGVTVMAVGEGAAMLEARCGSLVKTLRIDVQVSP